MSTYNEALTLQAQAAGALSAANLDAVVTLDGSAVPANLAAGANVVLIVPPKTEYRAPALHITTWTVYVIAAQTSDPADYWPDLDSITDALVDALDVDTSDAMTWTTTTRDYPALQLQLTT